MSVSVAEVEQVWREADCLWDKHQIERSVDEVTQLITADMKSLNPLVLVVMKGGMVFCARLVMGLRFPLELDYIHVTRYGMETSGADLHWLVAPQHNIRGRHILVVDDILDEGQTMNKIMENCLSLGALSVRCSVLVDKQHDRKAIPGFRADYTCLQVPDRYVFGYGMDYKGYLRNADGIFAVRGL